MSPHAEPVAVPDKYVEALRAFNRFYTQRVGILAPDLGGELSLAEIRVLYELAHPPPPPADSLSAAQLGATLGLDAGYLSRILRRFEQNGWLARTRSTSDGRQSLLVLTPAGRGAFEPLQLRSNQEAAALLGTLADHQRLQLVEAMAAIRQLLDRDAAAPRLRSAILREPRPGDMGWVVQQHGEIYAREYGLSDEFEALVASVVAKYVQQHQKEWERCWIAELNGERVGSVFVVRKTKTVAQLRLLILTPQARGLGLGARLSDECIAFARARGYRKLVLWTNSCLTAARDLYARRGFTLSKSEAYHGFGQDMVGETWELRL